MGLLAMIGRKSAVAMSASAALTLMLFSVSVAQSFAIGLLTPAEQNRLSAQIDKRPMVFFLARGPADSCGPGCSEWIAAEGKFVPGTTQRFRDFLGTLSRRDLPIIFHSAGGSTGEAVQTGGVLRERRMTAGVGRTIAERCRVFEREDPCQRLIVSGGEIKAQLRAAEGQCHSACVYAFAGASNRRVPVGAKLGVHSVRFDPKLRQQAVERSPRAAELTVADTHQGLEYHLALMGIDPRLQRTASSVSPRRMHVLSREEIQRFGIETGDVFETPWAALTDRSKHPFVIKAVTRAMESDPKERRTASIQFRCVLGRVWLIYQRELPPNEVGYAALVRAAAGGSELVLRRGPKKEASEIWAIPMSAPFLQSAGAAPGVALTEDVIPSGNSQVWSREIRFSAMGLSNIVDGVVKGCDSGQSPAEAKSGGGR